MLYVVVLIVQHSYVLSEEKKQHLKQSTGDGAFDRRRPVLFILSFNTVKYLQVKLTMKLQITSNLLLLSVLSGNTIAFLSAPNHGQLPRFATLTTPNLMMSSKINEETNNEVVLGMNQQETRRSVLKSTIKTTLGGMSLSTFPSLVEATAETDELASSTFRRTNTKLNFGYELITPPSVIKTSNKPLQTHLDEINLPTNTKGYTYGVTVDPIRIKSLKDFGTPSEVAAKIVMAELKRDGVLDVTLARDAKEDEKVGAYDVEYISDGTRGKKHFVTRSIVKDGKLFVLTVQVKQDDWNNLENEVLEAVQTFRVLDKDEY